MNQLKRLSQHFLEAVWQGARAFPPAILSEIDAAIQDTEPRHTGKIRFVIETELSLEQLLMKTTARQRAIDVFSLLRVWDTEFRNGVLIYVLLADRAVEIVADRGIHAKTETPEWQKICTAMEKNFAAGHFQTGAIEGIRAVSHHLTHHFPEHTNNHEPKDMHVVVL